MAEVRAREEALIALERGLTRWLASTGEVLQQARASSAAARSAADISVRNWAARVAALEADLRALTRVADVRPLAQELARARTALERSREAAAEIDGVAQRLDALQRGHAQRSTTLVNQAKADLGRRSAELGAYRAGGNRPGGGGSGTADGAGGGESAALAAMGLRAVDVDATDVVSNPIVDDFHKGGTTLADYRWAVQTWGDVVGPGVTRGMTRQDFERRDAELGAEPLRRTAAVYDLFLGEDDRIRVDRRPDGTYGVTNGRHRIQIARDLGIRHLPGEVG